jgi:hypothetical protein
MHDEKELSPTNSTEAGRQIDSNDEQPQSALASIRLSFDPDRNVNDESDVHSEKELSPRNSTEAGRRNDFNDLQLKSAFDSIRVSLDRDWNVNEESDLHDEKQSAPREFLNFNIFRFISCHPDVQMSISRKKVVLPLDWNV